MTKTFSNYFYGLKLPLGDFERLKVYIADQFGFNQECVKVLQSYQGHTHYPLFLDTANNYFVFAVNGLTYECIDGELKLLGKG